MLALSRKIGERICIGDEIVVEVRGIRNNRVILAVCAPDEVVIDRQEVQERRQVDPSGPKERKVRKVRGRRQGLKQIVREIDVSYAHRALSFERADLQSGQEPAMVP
ncbi:MAG: Global regulator protein family [Planctomycetota bacterium]